MVTVLHDISSCLWRVDYVCYSMLARMKKNDSVSCNKMPVEVTCIRTKILGTPVAHGLEGAGLWIAIGPNTDSAKWHHRAQDTLRHSEALPKVLGGYPRAPQVPASLVLPCFKDCCSRMACYYTVQIESEVALVNLAQVCFGCGGGGLLHGNSTSQMGADAGSSSIGAGSSPNASSSDAAPAAVPVWHDVNASKYQIFIYYMYHF